MKRLLPLLFCAFSTSKTLCCEQLASPTPDASPSEEIAGIFDQLANLPWQNRNLKGVKPLQEIKEFKEFQNLQSKEILSARNEQGDTALHALFEGSLNQYQKNCANRETTQHDVSWYFSFPALYELLLCNLDPETQYEWHNPRTGIVEKKESFFDLLKKYKDTPGAPQILERAKALKKAATKEKEIWTAMIKLLD